MRSEQVSYSPHHGTKPAPLITFNEADMTPITCQANMRPALLTLKVVFLTVAVLVLGWFGLGSLPHIGAISHGFTASAFIRERHPFHLVRPEWITGKDQWDILIAWLLAETKARVVTLLILWILGSAFFVWRHLRRRRHDYVPQVS